MTFTVIDLYEGEHLSNFPVYELKLIPKKCGMCVIKVSVSQPGCFHDSKE